MAVLQSFEKIVWFITTYEISYYIEVSQKVSSAYVFMLCTANSHI